MAATTTLTCPACSRPLQPGQNYCEACGARANDRPAPPPPPPPVRPPAVPVPRQVQMQEILTPKTSASAGAGPRYLGLWIFSVVLIVVAGLTFGALRVTGVVGGPTEAERQAVALARAQAELRPQLAEFMVSRAAFFAGERRYLPAMKKIRGAVVSYNQRLADVESQIDAINSSHAGRCGSCVNLGYPAYPRRPRLAAQLEDLNAVAVRMSELHTQLVMTHVSGGLMMAYSDLLSAVDLMGQDAKQNLATLDGMLGPQDEVYGGGASAINLKALRGNSSLPVIRRMNNNLLRLLDHADLPVGPLDLPGGRDRFPSDHSTSR